MVDNKPLTYEQLAPALRKWARYYCNQQFQYHELINHVWAKGTVQNLPDIKMASMRVKYDMIDYMRGQTNFRTKRVHKEKGKFVPCYISLSNPIADDADLGDMIPCKQSQPDCSDYFDWITKGMSRTDTLIIKLRFIEGLSLADIARTIGYVQPYVCTKLTELLTRIHAKFVASDNSLAGKTINLHSRASSTRCQSNEYKRFYNRTYYAEHKEHIQARKQARKQARVENKQQSS